MSGRIVPFPGNHRVSEIREAAGRILALQGKEADTYWRALIVSMRARMRAAQIEPQEAERELRAFANGVLWHIRSHSRPDSAA